MNMNAKPFQELIYSKRHNANKLKAILECSYATAWKKMKNPSLFTIGDLLDMDACGVATLEEIYQAIRKASNKR